MRHPWIPLVISLCLCRPALAVEAEAATGLALDGHASVIQNGPRPSSIQAAPLGGLWSLSLGTDLAWMDGQDLLSFYPAGALAAPPTSLSPGFDLGLRRHLSDAFFVGLDLSSLPKGYHVIVGADDDTWDLGALILGLSGGWALYRAVSTALYVEAGIGWLTLINGSLDRSGPSATQGSLQGSGLSERFGLGGLWFILPSVALEAQGGWRSARLPLTLSDSSGQQRPPSAPEFYADFSGPYARLGLSFFWGLSDPWGEDERPPTPPPPNGL